MFANPIYWSAVALSVRYLYLQYLAAVFIATRVWPTPGSGNICAQFPRGYAPNINLKFSLPDMRISADCLN